MKYFYIFSALGVILLSLAPFALIGANNLSQQSDQVVMYDTYSSKIKSLDPATSGDTTSAALQGSIYEALYCYDYLARPIKVVPQLAADMPEISPDLLTYTFRLKSGVKYQRNACFGMDENGRPKTRDVKADDFVLAFKRIADYHVITPMSLAFIEDKFAGLKAYRNKTQGYPKGDFSRYDLPFEGVRAIDDLTFQIKLSTPFPQLLYVLAITTYAPIPREVIDYYLAAVPMNQRSATINLAAVVGTGPYILDQFISGGDITLRRNPDYRDEFYPAKPDLSKLSGESLKAAKDDIAAGLYDDAGKKIPFLDKIVRQFVPEENPMWEMFLAGQSDISGIPSQRFTQVITPSKELTDKWSSKGITLLKYRAPAVYWLAFNNEDAVLGHSRSLRQALNLAFNVEVYIDVLFNGRGVRALNTVPGTFGEAPDLPASPYAKFDLAAAKAKLIDARKELEQAGVIKPGEKIPALTLDLGGREEDARKMGEFCQMQFQKVGLELKIELNDWPTLQERVENKLTQIYSMGWHADYPDPENFLQLYYTPNIKAGTNNTNFSNARFDELYKKSSIMLPSPQRTKVYAEMINILNEECPVLLLTEPVSFVLVHSWLHNVRPHPIGYGFGKYYRIDPAGRTAYREKK